MKNQEHSLYNLSKAETFSDEDILCALSQVKKSFEPSIAMDLIEYFHEHLQYDRPFVKAQLINFVEMAFRRIIENKCTADQAFGLTQQKGKYIRPDTTDRDIECAAFVIVLRRLGWTWLDATNEAVSYILKEKGSEKIAKRAYEEYQEELQYLSCEELWKTLPLELEIPPIETFIRKNNTKRKDNPHFCPDTCKHQRLQS